MKLYLLSDNVDTHTGMRLSGVRGEVVHTRDEFSESFQKAVCREDVGILLITELLAKQYGDIIGAYTKNSPRPIITVIPDRHTAEREASQK